MFLATGKETITFAGNLLYTLLKNIDGSSAVVQSSLTVLGSSLGVSFLSSSAAGWTFCRAGTMDKFYGEKGGLVEPKGLSDIKPTLDFFNSEDDEDKKNLVKKDVVTVLKGRNALVASLYVKVTAARGATEDIGKLATGKTGDFFKSLVHVKVKEIKEDDVSKYDLTVTIRKVAKNGNDWSESGETVDFKFKLFEGCDKEKTKKGSDVSKFDSADNEAILKVISEAMSGLKDIDEKLAKLIGSYDVEKLTKKPEDEPNFDEVNAIKKHVEDIFSKTGEESFEYLEVSRAAANVIPKLVFLTLACKENKKTLTSQQAVVAVSGASAVSTYMEKFYGKAAKSKKALYSEAAAEYAVCSRDFKATKFLGAFLWDNKNFECGDLAGKSTHAVSLVTGMFCTGDANLKQKDLFKKTGAFSLNLPIGHAVTAAAKAAKAAGGEAEKKEGFFTKKRLIIGFVALALIIGLIAIYFIFLK